MTYETRVTFLGCYLSSSVWQLDWLCTLWNTKHIKIQSLFTCKSMKSDPTEGIICLERAHTMVTLENLYYLCNWNDCHFLLGLLKYMCLVNVSEVTAFWHSLNQNWTGCVFSVIICSLFVWLSDQCAQAAEWGISKFVAMQPNLYIHDYVCTLEGKTLRYLGKWLVINTGHTK